MFKYLFNKISELNLLLFLLKKIQKNYLSSVKLNIKILNMLKVFLIQIKCFFTTTMFVVFSFLTNAQQIEIKGKVTCYKGDSLSGAIITVKGSNNIVKSDFHGNYRLKVDNIKQNLICSAFGYESMESKINSNLQNDFNLKSKGYEIRLKVNLTRDTVSYLAYYYNDKQYLKDTAKINTKGEFIFKGKESLPGGIYLVVKQNKGGFFELLVDDDQYFSVSTDTIEYMKNVRFKDSELNETFYNYIHFLQQKGKEKEPLQNMLKNIKNNNDSINLLKKQMDRIDDEVDSYRKSIVDKNPTSLISKIIRFSDQIEIPEPPQLPNGKIDSTFQYRYYRAHFFDHVDFSDDRILRTPLFYPKLTEYFDKVVHPHPDSIIKECDLLVEKSLANKEMFQYIVVFLTNHYVSPKIMGYDAIYVHMIEKYYQTGQANWTTPSILKTLIDQAKDYKKVLIGNIAPNINYLTTIDKKNSSLYEIKSKYTLLIFWSPECSHCKQELPELHKVYEKYKNKGLTGYSVSTDRDTAKIMNFIREQKLNGWINAIDIPSQDGNYYSNFRKDYGINSTPVKFILDENKKIIAKNLNADQLDKFIERQLNEDKKKD